MVISKSDGEKIRKVPMNSLNFYRIFLHDKCHHFPCYYHDNLHIIVMAEVCEIFHHLSHLIVIPKTFDVGSVCSIRKVFYLIKMLVSHSFLDGVFSSNGNLYSTRDY